jgi:hypothetical protein
MDIVFTRGGPKKKMAIPSVLMYNRFTTNHIKEILPWERIAQAEKKLNRPGTKKRRRR